MKKFFVLVAIAGSLLIAGCSHTVKDCDGNEYKTVKIGEQIWMAENLRTRHFSDGTRIPTEFDKSKYDFLIAADNKKIFYEKSGLYYSSEVVKDERNICPEGWHVPNAWDYTELIDYLVESKVYSCGKNERNVAKALAGTEGWFQSTLDECYIGYNPVTTNNLSEFSAYPAGHMELEKKSDDNYEVVGPFMDEFQADFWTKTYPGHRNIEADYYEENKEYLLILRLSSHDAQPSILDVPIEGRNAYLCNIRCVKNKK